MTEQTNFDDYWERSEYVADLGFPPDDHNTAVFFLWHSSREAYRSGHREIGIKLSGAGEKDYCHVKACFYIPRIVVTVGFTPPVQTDLGEEVGQVTDSRVEGSDRHFIANLQAWYYPDVKTLMLWEVDIFSSYCGVDPTRDFLLSNLWYFFEQSLLKRFSDCEKIVTPGHEPKYDDKKWREFLTSQGFEPSFDNTFIKRRLQEKR